MLLNLFIFLSETSLSYVTISTKIHLFQQEHMGKIKDLNPSSIMFLNMFNFEQSSTTEVYGG